MKPHSSKGFAFALAVLAVISTTIACGAGITGTYTDAAGSVLLELRSGGKASFTFMGDVAPCTYNVNENKLMLSCQEPAGKFVFTIHDDGSLTGPPGTFMPQLRKAK